MKTFGYHAWTEAYIDGRWVPLDGTLALGGIGAAHIKLGESNLRAASLPAATLPLLRVLGQLRIEIADVK
jgi:transglutaminase-like putative cysteine protease